MSSSTSFSSGFIEYHYRRVWKIKYYIPAQFKSNVTVLQQSLIAAKDVFEQFFDVCCERHELELFTPQSCFHRTGYGSDVLLKWGAKTTDLKDLLKSFGLYETTLWSKFINLADEDDWLATTEGQNYPAPPSIPISFSFDPESIKRVPLYILYNKYLNTSYEDPSLFIETYKEEQNVFDTVFPFEKEKRQNKNNRIKEKSLVRTDVNENSKSASLQSLNKPQDLFSETESKRENDQITSTLDDAYFKDESTFAKLTRQNSEFKSNPDFAMKTSFPNKKTSTVSKNQNKQETHSEKEKDELPFKKRKGSLEEEKPEKIKNISSKNKEAKVVDQKLKKRHKSI